MLQIETQPSKSEGIIWCPIFYCDWCKERINKASEGICQFWMSTSDMPMDTTLAVNHKRCNRQWEEATKGTHQDYLHGWWPLEWFAGMLINNLGIDWQELIDQYRPPKASKEKKQGTSQKATLTIPDESKILNLEQLAEQMYSAVQDFKLDKKLQDVLEFENYHLRKENEELKNKLDKWDNSDTWKEAVDAHRIADIETHLTKQYGAPRGQESTALSWLYGKGTITYPHYLDHWQHRIKDKQHTVTSAPYYLNLEDLEGLVKLARSKNLHIHITNTSFYNDGTLLVVLK